MGKGDKPVTYEEAHAPHHIAHRKGWLSLHTGEGTMPISVAREGDNVLLGGRYNPRSHGRSSQLCQHKREVNTWQRFYSTE